MFKRFSIVQAEADDLTRSLETRVRDKTVELERSHAHLREIETNRLLAQERERIMRDMHDMHDGVGSTLIAARQLSERAALKPGELTAILTECIDDLRLVIDSLEPTDGDLLNVIGNLRYRLTDRFARQGITLRWEISDFAPVERLAPRDILQILRIVQEAFANVLKHSGASDVLFSAALTPGQRHIRMSVRDNGRGVIDGGTYRGGGGRGLANMKQRAAAVGGELQAGAEAGGYAVILTLPLSLHGVADGK